MAIYKLGDICEIVSGSTPRTAILEYWDGDKKWITPAEITDDSYIITDSVRKLTELGVKEAGLSSFPKGTVILSSRAPIGKVAIAGCEMYCNQGFKNLVCSERINNRYLYWFLKGSTEYLNSLGRGATFKEISKQIVASIEINVPDMEQQIRAVENLERVSSIMHLRKQQLQKLDELVKARFVEMFGDPVFNEKGWDMPLIEDVVAPQKNALKAGPFGSALKKEYYVESGYKVYGQEQVISGDCTFGDYYIDGKRYRSLENYAVHAGDVLISLVGTYGKLLIIPNDFEPGIINPRLMKITFDKGKVNPYYFQHFFQSDSLKSALADNTHGGTMDILNLGIVRKIAMPLPPLELQNQFAIFVEQVGKSKAVIQKALGEAQLLFDSLMQKYFG